MSNNFSETLARWSNDAAAERDTLYAYAGLNPVKKTPSYRLVLDHKVALFDEGLQKREHRIIDATDTYKRAIHAETSSGYTVYVPPGRQLKATASKQEVNAAENDSVLKTSLYSVYGDDALVLTVNTNDNLEAYISSKIAHRKILLHIGDNAVKNQIVQVIRNNGKTLNSGQFTAVATALAKKGYLIKVNGIVAKLQSVGEKNVFLGKPIFVRDEVNFLDGYVSWYDFFNDLKAAVVKPIAVFLLGAHHIFMTVFSFLSRFGSVITRQPTAIIQFDLALQSFVRAVIYGLLTRYLLVLVAQLLSMMVRLMMTVPSIFSAIPGVINACTEQGVLRVASRGLYGFGTGFCGMFSSAAPEPTVENVGLNPNVRSPLPKPQSRAAMRNYYSQRYTLLDAPIPEGEESNSREGDSFGCSC